MPPAPAAGTVGSMDAQPRQPGPQLDAEGRDEVLERVSAVVQAVARQLSVRRRAADDRPVRADAWPTPGTPRSACPTTHGSFAEFVVDGHQRRAVAAIGPLPRQHGMLGVMLHEGQPLRLADVRADPRFEGWPAAHPELSDFLGMPDQATASEIARRARSWPTTPPASAGPAASPSGDERLLGLLAAHAAIALTNARLYERSRELSVLEERARLARELHDAVSQKLFALRLGHRRGRAGGARPGRAVAEIRSVAALAAEAHAELRAVIVGLRPADLAARRPGRGRCAARPARWTGYGVAAGAVRRRPVPALAPSGRRRCTGSRRRRCTTPCATPAPPRSRSA